ncbi:MAG: hypothetical protein ACYC6G_02610 [Desulfobaccales bacterium]
MSERQDSDLDLRDFLPKILFIFIATIYGSGFLISYFFLSKFGLHSAAPLFKLKYIHIGFMHLTLLAIFIIPFLAFLYITFENTKVPVPNLYPSSLFLLVLIVFLWLTIWYIFAFFAPHGELSKNNLLIFANFIPLVAILTIRVIDSFTKQPNRYCFLRFLRFRNELFLRIVILVYIITICWFNYHSFPKLYIRLSEMIYYERFKGINFFGIAFIIALLSWATYYTITKSNYKSFKNAIYCVSSLTLSILYYYSVLTFSIFIYPYIPAEKGGGDYFFSRDIIINIVNNDLKLPTIISDIHCYKLKIIDSSDDYIYVAKESDYCNESKEWRKMDKDKLPIIYSIYKEHINVIYLKY